MSEGVVAVQKWMGLRPFIFIELTGIDEAENVSCDIEFGGGVTAADLRDTLEAVLASIPPPVGSEEKQQP